MTDYGERITEMNKITMIDYGGSNLRSAQKAFEFVGADLVTTADPDIIRGADKLVLPGVGAFGAGMDAVRALGLVEPIHEAVQRGIPMLGICIGMQFLFEDSNEMGQHEGLALIPGHVVHFKTDLTGLKDLSGLKIPHVGWNQLEHEGSHFLMQGVEVGAYTYFVHSYHCVPADASWIVARTEYGRPFCAIVARENVYGIQFHPEKSHKIGLRIIQNFVEA
jgi:glutamine amidotransferase